MEKLQAPASRAPERRGHLTRAAAAGRPARAARSPWAPTRTTPRRRRSTGSGSAAFAIDRVPGDQRAVRGVRRAPPATSRSPSGRSTRPTTPGAPPENLQPGSMVFTPTGGPVDLRHLSQWWTWTPGACWRAARGARQLGQAAPGPPGRARRPRGRAGVRRLGGRRPAHRGRVGVRRPRRPRGRRVHLGRRGAARRPDHGQHLGRPGLPVAQHPRERLDPHVAGRAASRPTASGCSTWPATSGSGPTTGGPAGTPTTPAARAARRRTRAAATLESSYDPRQPQFRVGRKVIKGGSHLCADTYCLRYRPAARRPQMVDTGMSHVGFRVVHDPEAPA